MFYRDVRVGNYEPSQTSISSPADLSAIGISLGMFQSTIPLIGAIGGYLVAGPLNGPAIATAAVVLYYPVVDLVLIRQGEIHTRLTRPA